LKDSALDSGVRGQWCAQFCQHKMVKTSVGGNGMVSIHRVSKKTAKIVFLITLSNFLQI